MIAFVNKINRRNKEQKTREASVENAELKTRLDLLYDVALRVSTFSEVSQLIEQILCATQRIVKGSAASLLLTEEGKSEMYFQVTEDVAGNKPRQIRLYLKSGIADWVARHRKPLLINDAYKDKRFNKDISKTTDLITKSVVAVPLIRGRKTIGVLEVINKADSGEFDKRDLAILSGFASTEALILLVSMARAAINNLTVRETGLKGYKRTVENLAQAADAKDAHALGHSQRVMEYTMLAAHSLSFSPEELQAIEFAALLHDIGKIGIDEKILCKPGPLTDMEWDIMRQHPIIGAEIVGQIPFLEKTKHIILQHHERYDGKGYPKGLKGENIPVSSRLVAVADAFDTMTTDHSYRAALTVVEAINELVAGSGTQFCPLAVETFVSAFKKNNAPPVEKETDFIVSGKVDVLAGGDQKANKVNEDIHHADSEIFKGEISLVLPTEVDFQQVNLFRENLKNIENLQIVMVGWADDEGHKIIVSLNEPAPLIRMLKEIPIVDTVQQKGKKIVVILKTT